MKKTIRKIMAAVLAILAILSVFTVSVFAEEPAPYEEEPVIVRTYEDISDDEEVAVMYLCATANSLTGHVWLYFVNTVDCDIPLGYVSLHPGEGMSAGSLRNTRADGGGTYYNGEAMMASDLDKVCRHTHSLEMKLTKAQLEKVNRKIKSMNGYNIIFWNCGCFATQVWNCVSDKDVVHIVLPVFTIVNMCMLGAKKGVLRMQDTSLDRAFKQSKNGAYNASADSFRQSCVG